MPHLQHLEFDKNTDMTWREGENHFKGSQEMKTAWSSQYARFFLFQKAGFTDTVFGHKRSEKPEGQMS